MGILVAKPVATFAHFLAPFCHILVHLYHTIICPLSIGIVRKNPGTIVVPGFFMWCG